MSKIKLDKNSEHLQSSSVTMLDDNITNINQTTELGDSLRELNLDQLDAETRMSGIDMRSRLHWAEANSVLALDSLVGLGVLPIRSLAFSRQKKRLSVSIQGLGRKEIVQIVGGKQDRDKETIGSKLGNFFNHDNR